MADTHIIKRRGHKQLYDERKVYASVYSSCLNAHLTKIEAEEIAAKVTLEISQWIAYEREAISSDKIFKKVIEVMKEHDRDSAFMYETHRDLA